MPKVLTLSDVLTDQIDKRAFEAPAEVPERQYRIRTGEYIAHIKKTFLRVAESTGRRSQSLLMVLYNESEKYRGSCFAKVSWQFVQKDNGDLDLQSRLFQQLVNVLGAPSSAKITEILEAVEGEYVRVYGSEYFNVKLSDLLDKDKARDLLAEGRSTSFDFIETDQAASAYMKLGYKSEFMVLRIKLLGEVTP